MFASFRRRSATAARGSAWNTKLPTALSFRNAHYTSTAHQHSSTEQRDEAWAHFTRASRHFSQAVRAAQTRLHNVPAAVITPCASSSAQIAFADEAEEDDATLAALAPSIVRRSATAAASASLMRELGVVDRAEYRPPAPLSATSPPLSPPSLSAWTPYLMRVCQTGVQAQLSTVVILKHLWSPFQTPSRSAPQQRTAEREEKGSEADAAPQDAQSADAAPCVAPPLLWLATLPAAVRLQLVTHELARLARRRNFVRRHLQGSETASESGEETSSLPAVHSRSSLLHEWQRSVSDARAVLRCVAAPWLLSEEEITSPLLDASERVLLLSSLQLAAACQSEDVGLRLMRVFLRSVDNTLRTHALDGTAGSGGDVEALQSWYASESGDVYAAGMHCAAQQRTHVSPTIASVGGGFATAYALLVHRSSTMAHLAAQQEEGGGEGVAAGGSAWTAVLLQSPKVTMALLRALSDSVGGNVDHLHVVARLLWRLLEETDVGYSADTAADVRGAFCALLLALARVPLSSESKRDFLEDAYRRVLLNTAEEVVRHPSVLAACLHVCGAAGLSRMATVLFNKLSEPTSRSVAFEEGNVAAVCLSLTSPSALLQRCLSFAQTKVPLSADVVQAGVASALLQPLPPGPPSAANTTAMFALLDLLHSSVVQNRVTRTTAVMSAERTFFLRILTLLSSLVERDSQQQSAEAVCPSRSPAAAAMFQQWVREHDATQRGEGVPRCNVQSSVAHVAALLAPVTVGVLQELCLVLERRGESDGAVAATAEPSPLAEEVRRLLAAVPTPFGDPPLGTSSPPLLTLPPALQWRQLKEIWPLSEQATFLKAFLDVVSRSCRGSTVYMRYQDYMLMDELYRSNAAAAEWSEGRGVWERSRTTDKTARRPANLHEAIQVCGDARGGSVGAGMQVHVMPPLAEVSWWLQQHSPSSTSSLPQTLGLVVPPVVGCSSHSWAAAQTNGAAVTRVDVATYWLQRWVDAVEDGAAQPTHSLFRRAAVAALQRAAFDATASAGSSDSDDALLSAEEGERAEGPAAAAAARGADWRDGVVDLCVRGPASLAYTKT